jgi:hypothetical protein
MSGLITSLTPFELAEIGISQEELDALAERESADERAYWAAQRAREWQARKASFTLEELEAYYQTEEGQLDLEDQILEGEWDEGQIADQKYQAEQAIA